MPNYCENDLWVRGPKSSRENLRRFVLGEAGEDVDVAVFDFNRIIPMPVIYSEFSAPPHGPEQEAVAR